VENPIKRLSKQLGMTYREIAVALGVNEGTIKQNAIKEEISDQLLKALELLERNRALEAELKEVEVFKNSLKSFLK